MKRSIASIIVLLVITSSITLTTFAQESFVKVWGGVYNTDKKPLKNVTITLYSENTKVKTVNTNARGEFSLQLAHSKVFTIEASKRGLVSKKIKFSTKVPQKDQRGFMWEHEVGFTLFEMIEGLDISALKEPIASIQYYTGDEDFDFDAQYTSQMERKIDAIMKQIAILKVQEAEKQVSAANNLFNKSEYVDAWLRYDYALRLIPKHKVARKRFEEIKDILLKNTNADKAYRNAVTNADQLMKLNKVEEAIKMYKLALLFKPENLATEKKMDEAEKLLADNPTINENATIETPVDNQLTASLDNTNPTTSVVNTEPLKMLLYSETQTKRSIDSCINILTIKEKNADKKGTINILNKIAELYVSIGDFDNANEYYDRALKISQDIGDKQAITKTLNNLGVLSDNTASLDKAIGYFKTSLKISEGIKDKDGVAKMSYRLGKVYHKKRDLTKALDYYKKSHELDKKSGNKKDIAASLTLIGNVLYDMQKYDEALENYEKAVAIYEELNSDKELAIVLNNIGNVYFGQNKLSAAIDNYEKSIKIKQKINYKKGIGLSLHNLGNIYKKRHENDLAAKTYNKSIMFSKSVNDFEIAARDYFNFHEIMCEKGNFKKALDFFKQYSSSMQFITGQLTPGQVVETQVKYDDDKMKIGSELSMLKGELIKQKLYTQAMAMKNEMTLQIKNAELTKLDAQVKQSRLIRYISIGGFLILLIFLLILIRSYLKIKKANKILKEQEKIIAQQKNYIENQRDFVVKQGDRISAQNVKIRDQRDLMADQNRELTDSINFAKHIQTVVLMPETEVIYSLPEHFVYFRPKNVVSGDFYWVKKVKFNLNGKLKNQFVIVAADCTCPGVPGAVMSMLGVSLLNEVMNKIIETQNYQLFQSNTMLNMLRDKFIKALNLSGKQGEIRDGMDISLCILDVDDHKIQFSGANQSMYIIRPSSGDINAQYTLKEFKADRLSMSMFETSNKPYTKYEDQLAAGDVIYLFTDGFYNQFGGPTADAGGKKFMRKNFKQTLINLQKKPMMEQRMVLNQIFEDWKGNCDQIDDILIFGIKV